MDEIDIWKAADRMVFVYGEDADLHAAMRADEAADRGDRSGERLWTRVMQATIDLHRYGRDVSESTLN